MPDEIETGSKVVRAVAGTNLTPGRNNCMVRESSELQIVRQSRPRRPAPMLQCNCLCTVTVNSFNENGLGRNTEFGMRDCSSDSTSSA
jgi:hypothetical protein